ncbi:class I SAM-dependent methyltransferase [Chloroflexus aggregans]|uniref:Methyltransferase type 11 n=1 Tax=Chloroflexus aggregans (strain MD-66 / DSM 9485) TaxID=326427 RepID=B8G876_CHLAD|nr:class I SAM-dependent methyltransferase [Chloroflexus aggregans]ACL26130.1 Methyltransferase type 11 [Chloroflexus aggregans DSM 9485]
MDGVSVFDKHANEYDRWFDENETIYQAEVNALRRLVPTTGVGIEIGAGTGRFSMPFGIRIGVEPSRMMARIAKARNISICQAIGERLPFRDNQFDFALLVTVICFAKDVTRLLREVKRVIKVGGKVVIGFIDRDSPLGQLYQSRKDTDKFYREAHFYSVPEILSLVRRVGFGELQFCQTVFGLPGNDPMAYQVHDGFGKGAFVALSATKLYSAGDKK